MCHADWTTPHDAREAATPITIAVAQPDPHPDPAHGVGRDQDAGHATMPGWRFDPPGPPRGAVLVAPDIYGASPFYAEVAARLATAGFTTVLVEFFFREGELTAPSREAAFARREHFDESRALRDLSAALDTLTPGGEQRVGLVGFCLSGQFALDLCARRRDLAAVCFYPFPEGVTAPVAVAAPRPIDLAAQIHGPILSFWGNADYIPRPVIDRFAEAMREHRVDYTQQLYDGAGHGFLQGMVDDREDSEAARDAWSRALSFLTEHLDPASGDRHRTRPGRPRAASTARERRA